METEPAAAPGEVESSAHELIGGFPANHSAFDAVGGLSIRFRDPEGSEIFDLVCTAALIDANTAVTAKHCVDAVRFLPEPDVAAVFTTGPNSFVPDDAIEVIETQRAPGDRGGFNGFGRDVGVVQLAREVTGVTPVDLGSIDESLLGRNFVAIGYGVRDNAGQFGSRRVGKVRLRAVEGRTWEVLLGSFEAFFEWATGLPFPTDCDSEMPADPFLCELVAELMVVFESTRLEELDEVVAGGTPGDAQPCTGDSGSPLLLPGRGGRLTAYGVVSGGIGSSTLVCDYGAVYASFAPEVLEFLEEVGDWVDPCGDLPVTGICDGTVARRCTTALEGPRRVVELDCAALGLPCEIQTDGTVGCGADDASFAAPVEAPPAGESLLDARAIGDRVFVEPEAFMPERAR